MSAQRAYELSMVNRIVARDDLDGEVAALAEKIAAMPRLGLALTKKAVNQAEDLQGLHAGVDSVFGLHHLAHAHNAETSRDSLAGMDPKSMKAASGGS
jgi:enoyl-CoA hydratase